MKDNKYNFMVNFLIITLDVLIVFGSIACIAVIGITLSKAMMEINSFKFKANSLLFFAGTSMLIFILYSLRRILKSVIKEGPFNRNNVKSLKNISYSCFFITICYLINFFYNNQYKSFSVINIDSSGIHTDTEFLIFFFAGCLILILAQVYKQAVEVKEENDYTV